MELKDAMGRGSKVLSVPIVKEKALYEQLWFIVVSGLAALLLLVIIIPYAAFSLSMAILVCTGFMNEIPRDLDESACIDGCSVWGIFLRIIVPLMKPAVATVGIYTFLQCWNELMFANIFISKSALRTLPVGVQALSGQYTTEWGPIGAALAIATIPTLLVIKSAMISGENLPDIFFTWGMGFLGEFVKAGRVYCVDAEYDAYKAELPEPMTVNVRYDGKMYGVPYTMSLVTLYANLDILKEGRHTS